MAGSAPTRPRATNRPTSEEPPYKAGDRICPACGVGNDPARRFCRRCGNSLAEAPIAVPVTVPWYRRLFPGRTPQRYQAGDRPRSMAERGRPGRPVLAYLVTFGLMALILAAIGSYVAVPDVREQVDRTVTGLKRQLMPELADVHPSASNAAVDDDKATWWTGRGDDPGMTLRFSPAVDLGALVVHGGAGAEDFLQFRRPLRLRLVAGDQSATVDLADASDPQSKRIDLRGVSRLRVVVEEATGTPQGAPIAIRELEFKEVR
ncbi:MAG: zinc ribbon domain-containing protein [Chloroflexota bacterium]